MDKLKELIPFKGRNSSHCVALNYLGQSNNLYVMDNHKMALWCWLQKINLNKKYKILHIDRHTDTLASRMNEWIGTIKKSKPLHNFTINEYDALAYNSEFGKSEVFLWSNYLSIFLELYPNNISELQMVTNNDGDFPKFENLYRTSSPWELIEVFRNIFEDSKEKWIVNIDIDYFFSSYEKADEREYFKIFSDEFFDFIFKTISEVNKIGKIEVITISLSPECCGGWENAVQLTKKACKYFNIILDDI